MIFTPSPIQTLALWRLLLTDKAPPMQSKLKPRLKPGQRQELVDAGLVELLKRGRAFHISLTEKGWAWAAENLDARFSHTVNAAEPFEFLLLKLKKYMANSRTPLAEILRPSKNRDGSGAGIRLPGEKTIKTSKSPKNLENMAKKIRNAYLAASGGKWNVRVRIADLKKNLADIPGDWLEETIRKMQLEKKLMLYPLDNPCEITPEDEKEAVSVMGRKNHIIYMTAS